MAHVARNDLRSAHTLSADDEIPPPIPCFHAQQAAEKALKAVLIAWGLNPPKVHVLGKLHGQLPDQLKGKLDPNELARLDPWAVAGRYPGDVPDIPRELARELIALMGVDRVVGGSVPGRRPVSTDMPWSMDSYG